MGARDFALITTQNHQQDFCQQNAPLKIYLSKLSILTTHVHPSICKTKRCKKTKVYIILFTCSLTRAIHLELLLNHLTQEFIIALKRLIANAGRAFIFYSDNAKTFVVASKWSGKVNKDKEMQEHVIKELIKRKFNSSRTQSWGGQLERTVGILHRKHDLHHVSYIAQQFFGLTLFSLSF